VNVEIFAGVPKFDPSFATLVMEGSVAAIFLSNFVPISHNRSATAIAAKLDVTAGRRDEMEGMKRDVAREAVLDVLDARKLG
jgi:uncharacterized membrane protein